VCSAGVDGGSSVTLPVANVLAAQAVLRAPRPDLSVLRRVLVEGGVAEAALAPFWPAGASDCAPDVRKKLCEGLASVLLAPAAEAVAPLRRRGELVAMLYNRHRHVASCRKGRLGKDGCRFCVPFAHNIPTRIEQLRARPHDPAHAIAPRDVRWCQACVVGGRRSAEASERPFTDRERQGVRRVMEERDLQYELLPAVEALVLPPPGDGTEGSALRRMLRRDDRCLVVEIARPCPPRGAPESLPSTAKEVLALLASAVEDDVVLSRGWLQSADLTETALRQHMDSEQGVDAWLRDQCTDAYCDNGVVAQYSEVLSAALECNTAVYTLGAGSNAKASSSYFAKYSIKEQYNMKHELLVVIATAHREVTKTHISRADDSGTAERLSKHLAQRIINSGAERSATEAAMVVLNQSAETAEDTRSYVNAWDLLDEAVAISKREADYAPVGRAASTAQESDMRERNGFEGDSGWRGTASLHKYRVGASDVFASLAHHYMYRSRELRCLNALEFHQLYEVRKLVQDADPNRRVQQGSAFDPQSRSGTRGRKCQAQYRFLAQHPLAETHVCVRRHKFPMPVLCGGTGPRRPKADAPLRQFQTWAAYHAALVIPWGYEDGYPAQGRQSAAPVQKHFAPAITVGEFEQWRLALSGYSLELGKLVALKQPPGQLPLRLQRSSSSPKYPCYMERTCEVADGLLRDVSKRSSGRSLVCGDDRQQKAKLRLQCDVAEYRWWQVENAVGGFDAPPGVVDLGNTHRRQSRAMWNDTAAPASDERAWGADSVFDMLRVASADRAVAGAKSGAALGRATARAARCATLERYVKHGLTEGAGAVSALDEGCDDAGVPLVGAVTADGDDEGTADPVASAATGPATRSSWYGTTATLGFRADACVRPFRELQRPPVRLPSTGGVVSSSVLQREADRPLLNDAQDSVVGAFMQKVCEQAGGASGGGADPLLCIGGAGTGKSALIHEILARSAPFGPVVVTGFTGVCCAPFLSANIHKLCKLPAMVLQDTDPDGRQIADFQKRFSEQAGVPPRDIVGLIIDEVSFLTPEVLGRVSRLFRCVRNRPDEVFGGLPLLLAGHLSQLPPCGAAGTWFLDLLNTDKRAAGMPVNEQTAREGTRNFREGLRVLRQAVRFDLTHNHRAHLDPPFADCLAQLCEPTDETYVTEYLRRVTAFDPREARTRFGPFATLSNSVRHVINRAKVIEYGRLQKLPVFRWRWKSSTVVPGDVYDSEPSLWGYFCEGAPAQISYSVNPARGVANGTPAVLVGLQFTRRPSREVQAALAASGSYEGGVITLDREAIGGFVARVSGAGATWHGTELPKNVQAVLPKFKAKGVLWGRGTACASDLAGLVALPLIQQDADGKDLVTRDHRLTGMLAATGLMTSVPKETHSYDLAFALTDYKVQGMTLEQIVVLVGDYPAPLRHTLCSLYVMLSRVRSSECLRILQCQPGSVTRLAGPAMCQRDELRVFEQSYTDRVYDTDRAVRAYSGLDEDHSGAATAQTPGGRGRGDQDPVDGRADGACAMDTDEDSGDGGDDARGVPPCDVTPRHGVGDLVRGIRTAAAVGDGQTVVDSTRRLCAVAHAQGRVVRDAASSARQWDQIVRSLPAHLQREVRRAYLAYSELSCKISERDDPGRQQARAGASHVLPVTVGDEERRLAGALDHVRTATERHLGAYFDVLDLGAAGAALSGVAASVVLDQPPPRKQACVPLGAVGRAELDPPPPPKRARVVAAAVRAMDTEERDQAGSAVEAICGTRCHNGVREFRVKWAGRSETTWEPFMSLQHCAKQLTAFNEAQGESDCAMPAEPDSQPGDTPDEPKPS
jgi:hypothetical protein